MVNVITMQLQKKVNIYNIRVLQITKVQYKLPSVPENKQHDIYQFSFIHSIYSIGSLGKINDY